MTRHVVIANPENRRVDFFQAALRRVGLPAADVIAYKALLRNRKLLDNLNDANTIVRIESPGENETVTRELIALGADSDQTPSRDHTISSERAKRMQQDHGRIRYLTQWYVGYSRILDEIDTRLNECEFYNRPSDISLMFDKPKCHLALSAAGVPVPDAIENQPSCLDELLSEMTDRKWKRVFVKPAYSSSASGVVAFYFDGTVMRAVTSVETAYHQRKRRFYNNLAMHAYHERETIAPLLNFLLAEPAQVQQWLPKATLQGRKFDLRIVVINGRARHIVARTSTSPITNLHLGNRRGDTDHLIRRVGASWQNVLETAQHAAKVVPKSLYVGVDVLLQPRNWSPSVVEINAFGDLLPRVLHDGMNTYESEVRAKMLSKEIS